MLTVAKIIKSEYKKACGIAFDSAIQLFICFPYFIGII